MRRARCGCSRSHPAQRDAFATQHSGAPPQPRCAGRRDREGHGYVCGALHALLVPPHVPRSAAAGRRVAAASRAHRATLHVATQPTVAATQHRRANASRCVAAQHIHVPTQSSTAKRRSRAMLQRGTPSCNAARHSTTQQTIFATQCCAVQHVAVRSRPGPRSTTRCAPTSGYQVAGRMSARGRFRSSGGLCVAMAAHARVRTRTHSCGYSALSERLSVLTRQRRA